MLHNCCATSKLLHATLRYRGMNIAAYAYAYVFLEKDCQGKVLHQMAMLLDGHRPTHQRKNPKEGHV